MEVAMKYAGFWRRFVANIIDSLILLAIAFVVRLLFLGFTSQVADFLVGFLIPFIYAIALWTWRGQTPGKMIMEVKIVKADGSPISFGRAVLRYVGYIVSTIIIFIGFLMIAWDSKKQGLHDKIASTVVVKTS